MFNSQLRWGSLALAALLASACAKAPSSAQAQATAARTAPAATAPAAAIASAQTVAAAAHGFARLPDRGVLLDYAAGDVIHDGAYTWHRAGLSERHALHAMADGHLRLLTPSGKPLDITYDRHVEHDSGDWTWIGHIAGHPEQQTILTFGPHAAFGSIGQPGAPPLRLTVRNGSSWVVETNPAKIALIDNAATRPRKPDFKIPPRQPLAGGADGAAAMAMASAPATSAATASGSNTVDLLIGYTPGFANANNGTSGAITRLNYLVDVANAAYVNSAVSAKVRLVGTVAVSYTDATANDATLEKLTGYDSTNNTQTTPDPAFNALRQARETHGADLVALVRQYNDAENGGCGIAWLIGGGQSGVSQNDSFFGYSVLSDGSDAGSDGKTYYCLDETLAHEMGHNMGAAHDVETAKGDDGTLDASDYGAYPYSFGYKTTSTAGNFYTIMAYGDTGQTLYRIFSDPRSTFCGGRVCGTTSQADNARTLTQTIPIVATFRAAVATPTEPTAIPLRELDANGNGSSDLLFRSPADGRFYLWYMAGTSRTATAAFALPGNYSLVATGDLTGDRRTDLVWSSGTNLVFSLATASGYATGSSPYTFASTTQVLGAADMNGNGTADLLFRTSNGTVVIWYMNGTTRVASYSLRVPSTYQYVDAIDMTRDGHRDLVFTNAQHQVLLYINQGSGFTSATVGLTYSTTYTLAGVVDLNGDRAGDLLLRNAAAGKLVVWFMNGTSRVAYSVNNVSAAYHLAGKGDFNHDRLGDAIWTDGSGRLLMSLSNGSTFAQSLLPYTFSPTRSRLMDVD